jgi:hypothetical protein
MKESILNNDYARGSANPRFSGSNYPAAESRQFARQFDPRVENIDKINAKIKQILSCLTDGDKKPSKYLKDGHPSPPSK